VAGASTLVSGGFLGGAALSTRFRTTPKPTLPSAAFNPADFVGPQAVTPAHLPAGDFCALVVNGQVYVARMHDVAWELAGKPRNIQFYGSAQIDAAGRIVRLYR
ncbi:MAG: hypothetical protein K6T86_19960, partial [Pirellulales bacterium]|nr:hypothetical protein [Pirellulales bacterium]